ncbi:R-spondin-4 isoform X2 [Lissotriton helveticus]
MNDSYPGRECRTPSCDNCFSKDFCMKCKEGSFLNHGTCSTTCPPGTRPQFSIRECQECELTSWSPWTLCSRNGETCGYKWGTETRARDARRWLSEQEARIDLETCQPLAQEERRCRLRKFCPSDRSERRASRRKEKKRRLRAPHKEA